MTRPPAKPSPTVHLTARTLITLLAAIVTIARLARTEITAGERVAEGQPLVRLIATDAEARADALRQEVACLERRIAAAQSALIALRSGSRDLVGAARTAFDVRVASDASAAAQRDLLLSGMVELRDDLASLDARSGQIAQSVAASQAEADLAALSESFTGR
ncbi:MAG: hypothetical protein ACU0CI_12515 [Shimia sp.]